MCDEIYERMCCKCGQVVRSYMVEGKLMEALCACKPVISEKEKQEKQNKPCPHCGRKMRIVFTAIKYNVNRYRSKCDHCGAYGPPAILLKNLPTSEEYEAEAVRLSNHRPGEDRLREELLSSERLMFKRIDDLEAQLTADKEENEVLRAGISRLRGERDAARVKLRLEQVNLSEVRDEVGLLRGSLEEHMKNLNEANEQIENIEGFSEPHPTCETCGHIGTIYCAMTGRARGGNRYCFAHTSLKKESESEEKPELVECPWCEGYGATCDDDGDGEPCCPVCGGTGLKDAEIHIQVEYEERACNVCRGSGFGKTQGFHQPQCSACGGRGIWKVKNEKENH